MKKRIWELDALRGICILAMVIVHLLFDLVELYGVLSLQYPAWFSFIKEWGGVIFLLISGICATLGSRSVRRGAIVFSCGMLCTAVTYAMYKLHMAGEGIVIRFGVLHCLGCCMVLWAVVGRLSTPLLGALAAALAAFGFWLRGRVFTISWLFPLGFISEGFSSADYFPLILNFGFFLIGAVLGRILYREKRTLFPKINDRSVPVRFLTLCGRHSLAIYLLHQPALMLIGTAAAWMLH